MNLKRNWKFTLIFILVCPFVKADDYRWFGWHLFQGKPPAVGASDAAIDFTLSIEVTLNVATLRGSYYDVKGKITLKPETSYRKPGVTSALLLRHELYHYKLGEAVLLLFEYEMEKRIWKSEYEIYWQFDSWQTYFRDMQIRYDDDTEHSRNREEQLRWESFIDEILEVL